MRLTDFEHNERTVAITALGSRQLTENRGGTTMSDFTTSIGDYRAVEILPDSVIYCDPPYKGTAPYRHLESRFDHEAFYEWCEKQTSLVLISEYWMPEGRFVCIAEKPRRSTFSATNNALERIEKVFVPKGQYDMYKKMITGAPRGSSGNRQKT